MSASVTSGRRRTRWLVAAAVAIGALAGPVAVAAPAQAAGRCVDYVYRQGGYAACIGYAQQLINWHMKGMRTPLVVDNAFGPKTYNAVSALQASYRIQKDGIIGPQTWRTICVPQMGPGPIAGFPYAAARAAGC